MLKVGAWHLGLYRVFKILPQNLANRTTLGIELLLPLGLGFGKNDCFRWTQRVEARVSHTSWQSISVVCLQRSGSVIPLSICRGDGGMAENLTLGLGFRTLGLGFRNILRYALSDLPWGPRVAAPQELQISEDSQNSKYVPVSHKLQIGVENGRSRLWFQ